MSTTSAPRTRSSTPVADARHRFAARARARRLASARPALVLAGLAATAAALAWVLLASSAFAVRTVAVAGTHRLTADQVRHAVLGVSGKALLRVDLATVRAEVAALPGVREVRVERDWPHTLRITVVERDPVATVRHADGWWLIDSSGVQFGPPAVHAPDLRVMRLPAQGADAAAASAAAVLRALPAALLASVTHVEALSVDGVRLGLRGGATVVWGSADRSAEKARILATLLTHPAHVYDVSSPSVVTTR